MATRVGRTDQQGTDRGPTQREQQKQATRKRLLEAAVEVFGRDGYVGSRVEDIATTAGASRATFYLHFGGKVDVVRQLMGPLRADSERLYHELDATDLSWDSLHDWTTRVIDYWIRNRDAITVINQAIAVEPDMAAQLVAGAQASAEAMTGYLGQWPNAKRDAIRLRVTMFILQLERVCYFWIVRGVPFDRETTLIALTDAFHTALHPGQYQPVENQRKPNR